jgi:hypothetical protein
MGPDPDPGAPDPILSARLIPSLKTNREVGGWPHFSRLLHYSVNRNAGLEHSGMEYAPPRADAGRGGVRA